MPHPGSRALRGGLCAFAVVCALPSPSAAQTSPRAPRPDPRVGLRAGDPGAASAAWNLKLLSNTPPSAKFVGSTNSDLAFISHYAIQGNYNGYQVWDIGDPLHPTLKTAYYCPDSQSDVSVYKNLIFVSGEGLTGRLDCGAEGVAEVASKDRLRGLRIFDITDISAPRNVGNVQTCRGSHTHSVLVDPRDPANVYVYISGSATLRSPGELPGCAARTPNDSNSALFRIEVIKVPLAHPEQAAVVSSPRIFNDLVGPAMHADSPEDRAETARALDSARAAGAFIVMATGGPRAVPDEYAQPRLDSIVKARGGSGPATAADSAALRAGIQAIMDNLTGPPLTGGGTGAWPTQCHDITLYPAIGLAAGACRGFGLLLDIRDPANPVRIGAVSDSNFAYWHSATFNNDGSKVLFTDEWGGGFHPKCRATDKSEWGADAIFTLVNGKMEFKSYYKMPAVQTAQENCVAHNGSLIPIPGRDIMAQSWYQGGVSLFEWTDAAHPREIAYFDRGPLDSTRLTLGGTWSSYWYNGVLVSSEITRGLDIFELLPSAFLSRNEIDAAKSVHFDYLNTQGQPKLVWPPSFSLARAYLDQLERDKGLPAAKIAADRAALAAAEKAQGAARKAAIEKLAGKVDADAKGAAGAAKARMLSSALKELAAAQ